MPSSKALRIPGTPESVVRGSVRYRSYNSRPWRLLLMALRRELLQEAFQGMPWVKTLIILM